MEKKVEETWEEEKEEASGICIARGGPIILRIRLQLQADAGRE